MSAFVLLVDRDLRESMRHRWLFVYTAAFAILAALVAWGGAAAGAITGTTGFGPVVAQFVVLVMLFSPLMGLTMGAQAIVRDRERGIVAYLLAQPVSNAQYFASKIVSLALSLGAAVLFGFAVVALTMATLGTGGSLADFSVLLALTWLLTVAMASAGVLVSVWIRKAPTALGIAIALWLTFTVFGDLGLMATAMATHLGVEPLLYVTLLNPVEAFKIAAIAQLSGSLDSLGPGGRLATDVFGAWLLPATVAALSVWLTVPIALAWSIFRRQDAI
jgi:ABC-type transport system involved in multi-copper enzyme maturation permease subunit